MPTPHNSAFPGDFADTVLMPGDPLRAEFVAKNFLTNSVCVNRVRGMLGFTGEYHGTRVSVMASGMGMPSMGIYSYELFKIYGVTNIIRIGSAGAILDDIHLRDIVFGMGSCTDSAYAAQYGLSGNFAPIASYKLLSTAVAIAEKRGVTHHVGNLLCSDKFYNDDENATMKWAKMGVMAVEMESAALYMNAARLGKNALAICTISDHIARNEETSSDEREKTFMDMMEIALDTAAAL